MNTYRLTYIDPSHDGPSIIQADGIEDLNDEWLTFYIGDKPTRAVKASAVLAVEVERSALGDDVVIDHVNDRSRTYIRIDQPIGARGSSVELFCEYARKHGFGRVSNATELSGYTDTTTGMRRDVYTIEVVPS